MKIFWVTREEVFNGCTGSKIAVKKRIEQLANRKDTILEVFSLVEIHELKKTTSPRHLRLNCFTRQKKSFFTFLRNLFYFPLIPYTISNRVNNNMLREIEKAIIEKKPELIIFEHIHTSYYKNKLLQLIKKYDVKTVLGCHNIEFEELQSIYKFEKNLFKKIGYFITYLLMLRYEKRIFKENTFNLYYFLSKSDMNFAISKLNPEINAIYSPPGVDMHGKYLPSRNGQKINIAFVGVMSYGPNIQACLYFYKEVFCRLKNRKKYRFFMVGSNPSIEIKKIALNDKHVIVTGFVDNITDYYKMMDIIVIPMVSGAGVKIKLFEAMSYGKFVVSTQKGTKGTEFQHGKHLVIANNPEEFLAILENYPENRNRFERIAHNGYYFTKVNFTWEKICNSFYAELEGLINNDLSRRLQRPNQVRTQLIQSMFVKKGMGLNGKQ